MILAEDSVGLIQARAPEQFLALRVPRAVVSSALLVAAWLSQCCHTSAQVLYDAAAGTLPSAQGWNYLALPGTATQGISGGVARLDTSAQGGEMAGYFRLAPTALEHSAGFGVLFTVQLFSESHWSTDRAGFSVIVLSQDKKGIELGFWADRIFAQSDTSLFTHAEEAAVNTSTGLTDYMLILGETNYVLWAADTAVLSGRLRDYTAFVGPYDPYETPNFLFFGDDTSSALGVVGLSRVVLVTPPKVTFQSPGVIGWDGVSNQTYSVERSLDLTSWTSAGSVFSATTHFTFTNSGPMNPMFFRVRWP